MKRKLIFICVLMAVMTVPAMAGGLMTNTNYHIAFDRMMARGTTFEIDGAYSNPAGMVWTREGWQFSFNWQIPHQNRDITTTFPMFIDENHTHKYKGKASAPFVPGIFAAYKKGKWAVSAMLGIVGSGGFVKYDEGVPMFTAPLMALLYSYSGGTMTPDKYTIDAKMKGKQYVYGGQVSVTHKITDYLAASVGLRAVYYDGYYRGHIITNVNQIGTELLNVQLDCDQTAWGFSPIIGLDFHMDRLTVAAKYEFRTKINTKNKTNELSANVAVPNVDMSALAPMLSAYQDGARTRYDMPAMLMVAVGYDFTDKFRATAEYHFFDDKNAKMANDRQKTLERGTHEFLIGAEYDINKIFTVSAGAQRTDYGLSDDYQTHTSFACDSYSVGLGGAANINEHLRLNVGYFWTMYSDYKKEVPAGNPGYCNTTMAGTDVFSRTNGVLGIGFDYKF